MADDTKNQGLDLDTNHGIVEAKYPGKGFKLGEYVITDTLGHGSMATVFLAEDSTRHEVAIKIFQEGPGVSPTMLERFRREAEAAKKLRRHPHIMKVYATGKEGPYHYIVMEPIKNSKTLEDTLETQPMSAEAIVRIVIKVAHALQYAHSRNIVHRDVKPTNIMINEFGEPLLTDFGVAALIDWPSCTVTGALTGTPLYMSPEQARSERVGPASDIYSMGVVLFEALTGVLPYTAQHAAPVKNVLEAVKTEPPRRPRSIRKDITPDLEAVLLKSLEKDPGKRYAEAQEFADDLERALMGRHVSAKLFSYWERFLYLARRYDQFITAFVVMVTMLLFGAIYFRHQILKERYEKLLSMAQLRNFALRLPQATAATDPTQTPDAWHGIRVARRAMNNGKWSTAISELRSAIDLSLAGADNRTAAIAQLEQARCLTMLDHTKNAQDTYREILKNPDASPSVVEFAQLEGSILALLENNNHGALEILSLRALPIEGAIREAIVTLAGDAEIKMLLKQIETMPGQLKNDAHLAAAVRYFIDKDERNYSFQLKRCVQTSSPSYEWPAPFARRLHKNVQH